MSSQFTVGLESGRNSSKVLKPPGGGSSDIFGILTSSDSTATGSVKAEEAGPTKKRLFGTEDDNTGMQTAAVTKKPGTRRNPITGEGIDEAKETGFKIEEKGVIDSPLSEKADEQTKIEPPKIIQTSIRVRNPPGGKSSGIF